MKLWRVTDPEVKQAVKDGRVEYIGKRRGHRGYAGVVSKHWVEDGQDWFEIDINCIGGVPAPLAKRNPLKAFFNHFRTGG